MNLLYVHVQSLTVKATLKQVLSGCLVAVRLFVHCGLLPVLLGGTLWLDAGLRLTNTNIFITNNKKSLSTSESTLFIPTRLPANQQ